MSVNMVAYKTSQWRRTLLLIWCCLTVPLMPRLHSAAGTGMLVAEGWSENTTSRVDPIPPYPASGLHCFSYDFSRVTCTWMRGGQNDSVNSTDILMYREVPSSGAVWKECRSPEYHVCGATSCKCKCKPCYRCHYLVRTTNEWKLVADSTKIFFNTETDSKLHPPSQLSVSNHSDSRLLLSWRPPDELLRPRVITYIVEYRWEGTPANESWYKKQTEEGTVKYTLVGLGHPYGLYKVRVKAQRANHSPTIESNYSEVAEGRTTEGVPRDLPKNFRCVDKPNRNSNRRQVQLSWKPLSNEFKLNGELLGYLISYTSRDGGKPTTLSVGVNVTNYTVYDLQKDQYYYFHVQARNSMGTSVKKSSCNRINAVTPEPISVGLVVGVCSAFLMAVVLVVIIFCRIKKSIRKFPAIRPPSLLRAENDYLSENRNHIMVREPEEFDDLIPCQLFVDLGPKEKDMVDIDIITDGFDIGDKPRGTVDLQNDVTNFDDHPLLSFKGDPMLSDAPLASEPLLPSPRREEDPSSGEEYNGAGPSSPVSVGSGGSYLHIRDDDELTYSCMTKDGLSPVQKEDIEGQRVRGESSQASAPRPQVDGLPLLLWRQESSNPDDDYPGDGDTIDSYLQMSRSVPPCTGPRPVREDPGRDRASSQGAELSKAPSKGAKGKERGDSAGASCVDDGTVLDYVQQGFVPGAAASSDRMYSPSESPADAYSQMGLRGGARATAALCDSTGSSSQDSAGPSQSQARQETGGAEATRGQGSRSEEDVNGAGIDSYVQSAFDRPHVRASQEPSQCTVDSSNSPRDRASLVSLGATAPCAPPVSETTPTNKPPGATNIARTQSADALSDDSEEGALNYVRVGLDSDGIDVESMNGVEPANVNGYVVQGMLPNMSVPPMARNVAGEAMHSAAPSGYVDQAQLSNLSPPPSAQPATHSDHIHMNGIVGGSSGGGYITAAQMSNIAPLDPEVAFAEESPSNNNNNNRGQENVVAEPLVLQNESRLETDNLANVTQQEATGLLSGNLGVVPSTAITDDGVVPNGPVGPGSYVTTDQLTNLPLQSPQPNCHANRDAGK